MCRILIFTRCYSLFLKIFDTFEVSKFWKAAITPLNELLLNNFLFSLIENTIDELYALPPPKKGGKGRVFPAYFQMIGGTLFTIRLGGEALVSGSDKRFYVRLHSDTPLL